ncbi:MAG: hypothetical protein WCQ82_03800 [Bacteroidaceae bacterium]|nr:hypothetical protein [Bacteroidaceae bacterium]
MASRRKLKKAVNYIAGELFVSCMLCNDNNKEKSDELLVEVLNFQDEFVSRINHTEQGRAKMFYRKFYTDFDLAVDKLSEKIEL